MWEINLYAFCKGGLVFGTTNRGRDWTRWVEYDYEIDAWSTGPFAPPLTRSHAPLAHGKEIF